MTPLSPPNLGRLVIVLLILVTVVVRVRRNDDLMEKLIALGVASLLLADLR